MSDYYIGLLERTARESGYSYNELEEHFNQICNVDGCSIIDFVWLAMERML